MSMMSEFKEFALKGNVMDMAIGIIIGGAFGKIVSSLVNDVLMPVVGKLLGGVSFAELFTALDGNTYASLAAAEEAGAAVLKYGMFLQNIVDFVLIAFTIFLVIKAVNRMRRDEEDAAADESGEPSEEVQLLTEIRDSLARG